MRVRSAVIVVCAVNAASSVPPAAGYSKGDFAKQFVFGVDLMNVNEVTRCFAPTPPACGCSRPFVLPLRASTAEEVRKMHGL